MDLGAAVATVVNLLTTDPVKSGLAFVLGGLFTTAVQEWRLRADGRRQDRRDDLARKAAATAAREARLLDQRKDVYEEILEYAYRTEDTVDRTEPLITWAGAPGPPAWPSEDEVRRQNARTATWGSPLMRAKLLELKGAVQAFQGSVFILQTNRPGGLETAEQVKEVGRKREVVKRIVKELIDLANQELTGDG